MKIRLKFSCLVLLMIWSFNTYRQIEQFNYKRSLLGINEQWHKLELPDEIFGKVSGDLSDIRIFGITEDQDTVEAPYLVNVTKGKRVSIKVPFEQLNASHNESGYYYTFKVSSEESINQIKLDFAQNNFDWRVNLEASHDQYEWYSILENYRILSINNELANYQFTTLSFPESQYRYYRIKIMGQQKSTLTLASVARYSSEGGRYKNYPIKKLQTTHKDEQTEVDVSLKMPVPLSSIRVAVEEAFDYYRPVNIKYLSDSVETDKGWKYQYKTLASGTLNSIESNEFQFSSTVVSQLKIVIQNDDNQPLNISSVRVKGYVFELIPRFTQAGTYYLVYGGSVRKPQYDISRFEDTLPESLSALSLGDEEQVLQKEITSNSPLIENKVWLWVVIFSVIGLIGWFTISMMKQR